MGMRNMQCICRACGNEFQFGFDPDNVPDIFEDFEHFCPACQKNVMFYFRETKKLAAEKRRINDEKELRRTVKELAEKYGCKCSFLYQSVTITTSLGSWRFDYHKKMKHLIHESTYKYNLNTGNPSFWHHQFDKKMSIEEVFQYIENHDKSTLKRKK